MSGGEERGPAEVFAGAAEAKPPSHMLGIVGREVLIVVLAAIVGGLAALAVIGMSWASQMTHVLIFGIPVDIRLSANDRISSYAAIAGPVTGGVLVACIEYLRRRWKLADVIDPLEANVVHGGRLSLRSSLVHSVQTLISNGFGASVGLESAYVQTGGALASWIAQRFELTRADMRMILGCGAAGAIAAAFNAPLTGVFYACELVAGVYSVRKAGPFLVSAFTAAFVAGQLSVSPYSIDIGPVLPVGVGQIILLVLLGILNGLVGIGVMRLTVGAERCLGRTRLPHGIRIIVGGLSVGLLAIYTPQVLAAGHGAMALDLNLKMTITAIIVIVGAKIAACVISLASGYRGGLFFASLFVGSLTGKLFALVVEAAIFGGRPLLDQMTFAITGMATLGVAVLGAPLTMGILVLETTRNFDLSASVLVSCAVTSIFVRAVFGHSFSTWRLHLKGVALPVLDEAERQNTFRNR